MNALAAAVAAVLLVEAAAAAAAAAGEPQGRLSPRHNVRLPTPAAALVEVEAGTTACLAAPPAAVRITVRHPTDVLERDEAGRADLNSDMYRHHELNEEEMARDQAARDARQASNATSCCGGLACPFTAGVCCPGSTHCCDEGYTCSADFPPVCLDERVDTDNDQDAPTRIRVTRVTVHDNKGQKVLDTHPHRAPVAAPPGTMGLPADQFGAAAPPAAPSAPPPAPGSIMSTANFEPDGLSAGDVAARDGTAWPPMLAFASDGTARRYAREDQRDWCGNGLERNGTMNYVASESECLKQCDALDECRVARFTRTNGECWLDSEVAPTSGPCPAVRGLHNCVSYVKRATDRDAVAFPFPNAVGVSRGEWHVANSRNWLPTSADVAAVGGRLLRNGKRNRALRESDCVKQCAGIRYCAAAMYVRGNGECWLSSKVADRGVACAVRGGTRDCASYVKRKRDEVDAGDTRPLDTSPAAGVSGSVGAGPAAQGSTLSGGSNSQFTLNVEQPN